MLGKKSSVAALKKRLSRIEGVRYTFAPLCQGRTQRWLAAWSYRKGISLDEVILYSSVLLPIVILMLFDQFIFFALQLAQ